MVPDKILRRCSLTEAGFEVLKDRQVRESIPEDQRAAYGYLMAYAKDLIVNDPGGVKGFIKLLREKL